MNTPSETLGNMFQEYKFDLMGSKDSYSDSDKDSLKKPSTQTFNNEKTKTLYSSCERLLFQLEMVIKNKKGEVILKKFIKNFQDIVAEKQ